MKGDIISVKKVGLELSEDEGKQLLKICKLHNMVFKKDYDSPEKMIGVTEEEQCLNQIEREVDKIGNTLTSDLERLLTNKI